MTFNGETLWVWMTRYPDGTVGSIGAYIPQVGHTPLMGRSEKYVRDLESIARQHGERLGQEVWLRKFVKAEDFP